MLKQIMSHTKFWIVRFRDRTNGDYTYVTDIGDDRRAWWWTPKVEEAAHFRSKGQAHKALRSPIWAREGYTKRHGFITEVVEIDETIKKKWIETQVISNENALIQLARLAEESNEHNDDSED